ncbi:hypothetical protein HOR18_gp180 [Staphylococcus phage vB_SscM-1]|uniref:Uncharacterized protein n=2 Tax=Sciuriunavirus SscM1 TaxID=2734053 RepID=A0A1X9I9X5_9CAUD|nr:hypothetical protein HOR18_gp180 [Staphylococcus phage vB_SscM-1]ANT44843.1 hypothetical protein vB_SscM-1_179 [Staphylococcus phage vB_SscM-1]ANT45045.1 hypothetical protein vB_SscM-2_178 [Staphylococcus phage vB_SscM-2]
MILLNMLLTILILGINAVTLFLLFIGLRYLDTKLMDSKHREPIMITAMFIYSTVMIIFSKLLKEGFTVIWG